MNVCLQQIRARKWRQERTFEVHLHDVPPTIMWNHSIDTYQLCFFCCASLCVCFPTHKKWHIFRILQRHTANGFFLICNFNAYVNVFTSSTDIHSEFDSVPVRFLLPFNPFSISVLSTHSYYSVIHGWSIIFSVRMQSSSKRRRQEAKKRKMKKRIQNAESALNIPIIPSKW